MSVKWKPVARLPVVITVEYLHVKLLLLKCSHISSDQQKEPQESHDENPQQAKSSCVFNVPSSVWSESTRSNTVKFPVHCILNVCAMDPRFPVLNTHTHTQTPVLVKLWLCWESRAVSPVHLSLNWSEISSGCSDVPPPPRAPSALAALKHSLFGQKVNKVHHVLAYGLF